MLRSLSLTSTNALEHFDSIEQQMRGRSLLLLLDYDGTLSPIVSDPTKAYMPEDTRAVLREITRYHTTGIITGRSLEKVSQFVDMDNLIYAGSHGFDIRGPHNTDIHHQVAVEHLPRLNSLRNELVDLLRGIDGAGVEDNTFSVSVHYRNVSDQDVQRVFQCVDTVVSKYDHIRKGTGKKVVELKPDIMWNKGKAILWLLEALDLRERDDVFTIYVGDDTTDEDGFQIFCNEEYRDCRSEVAVRGCGILVTDEERESSATYTLRDPQEVCELLRRLLELGKRRGPLAFESGLAISARAPPKGDIENRDPQAIVDTEIGTTTDTSTLSTVTDTTVAKANVADGDSDASTGTRVVTIPLSIPGTGTGTTTGFAERTTSDSSTGTLEASEGSVAAPQSDTQN